MRERTGDTVSRGIKGQSGFLANLGIVLAGVISLKLLGGNFILSGFGGVESLRIQIRRSVHTRDLFIKEVLYLGRSTGTL
jgi:hypothetical protein